MCRWGAARRRLGSRGAVVISALWVVTASAVAALTVTVTAPLLLAGNALSTGWAKPEYYDRLAAIHRLEGQAALLCTATLLIGLGARRTRPRWAAAVAAVALGAAVALLGGSVPLGLTALVPAALTLILPRRELSFWPAWLGAALLLLGVALVVQIAAPLAASLFAWPALLAAVAIALQAWRDRPGTLVLLALPLGLGLAQLLTLAHFTFSGIGAPLPIAMLLFVVGALPLLRPLLDALPRGRPLALSIFASVVAAMAIALWVRLDAVASSVPTYLGR